MSRAWCEANRATKPQNFTEKEDMITAHQANGTGAYMLKSRSRHQDGAGQESELVGNQGRALGRQRRRGDLPADRFRRDADGGADVGRSRPGQRSAAAGCRGSSRIPASRCWKAAKIASCSSAWTRSATSCLLQRQGQEPVQGQARAAGLVPGDRHRGDPDDDNARPVATVGRAAAVARTVDAGSKSACRSTRRRPSSF